MAKPTAQIKLQGLDKVINEINKQIKRMGGASKRGLQRAVEFVRTESRKITPQDTGFLKQNVFTEVVDTFTGPVGVVFYTAKYAAAVHENIEQKAKGKKRTRSGSEGTFWDRGEPKFLENTVRRKKKQILAIIKTNVEPKK